MLQATLSPRHLNSLSLPGLEFLQNLVERSHGLIDHSAYFPPSRNRFPQSTPIVNNRQFYVLKKLHSRNKIHCKFFSWLSFFSLIAKQPKFQNPSKIVASFWIFGGFYKFLKFLTLLLLMLFSIDPISYWSASVWSIISVFSGTRYINNAVQWF